MADDKTTKMPEQTVTDTGPGKEFPLAPEKTPAPPEAEKKTEQQAKSPQVSVYDFAEIMKGKKAEERAAASGGEKPAPAKTEKPEKQPEAPKKAEGKQEKPKEPEQPKRRGRPPKEDKDKAAAPKPKAPAQKKPDADWQSIDRLAKENGDFHEFIELVSVYFQTGTLREKDWDNKTA